MLIVTKIAVSIVSMQIQCERNGEQRQQQQITIHILGRVKMAIKGMIMAIL